jgi:hypothetical protein
MNLKRLLPIGVQTFAKMRGNNYVYVDKTEHIYRMAATQGVYFLSRPRRFGKSLTVSTLQELFEGNRPLFKGLWIEDKWDWSQTAPVIHFSFAKISYQGLGLERALVQELGFIAQKHAISLPNDDLKTNFQILIQTLHDRHGKVVILIDKYDKPIIDYLENDKLDQAKANQRIMKTFYSVLKDAKQYLQLLFITGVSKFAKVSIFSDLNHLKDLTLDPNFATLVGYTQQELENNFDPELAAVAQFQSMNREDLLKMIKEWYNGFSWDGVNRLYNPFGTLTFLSERIFTNH